MVLKEQLNLFLQKDSDPISSFFIGAIICLILVLDFYIWRESKNWFNIFITFSYSNNNNFSYFPFHQKRTYILIDGGLIITVLRN